jgi:hypothetical protein
VRSKLHGAEREAEIRLIQTPSPAGWALVQKMELVEHLVTLDTEAGPPAYPLVIVALAAIRADILALGFAD